MNTDFLTKLREGLKSFGGILILTSIALALVAAYFRGPYLLVNTVIMAGMLSMVSLGLSLIFGVMNVGMFAHGEFFMLGSLVAYYFITPLQKYLAASPNTFLSAVSPVIAVLLAFIVGALAGVVTEYLAFRPLRAKNRENWVMNTFFFFFGISVIMINGHQLFFGSEFKGIPRYWTGAPLSFLNVYVSIDRVAAVVLSLLSITAFWLFMRFTNFGRAIRAVSQDEVGALMVGIPMEWVMIATMALACGLSSMAGSALLFMYPSYPMVGMEPLYLAWFVVILVGLGNTMGALVGAFLVALFKVLTVEFVGAGWDFVIPTGLIMLILAFKPSGIFGSEVRSILDK